MMFKRSGMGRFEVLAVLRPITTTRASFVFAMKNCLSSWLLQVKVEWLEFFALNSSALKAAIRKNVMVEYSKVLGMSKEKDAQLRVYEPAISPRRLVRSFSFFAIRSSVPRLARSYSFMSTNTYDMSKGQTSCNSRYFSCSIQR